MGFDADDEAFIYQETAADIKNLITIYEGKHFYCLLCENHFKNNLRTHLTSVHKIEEKALNLILNNVISRITRRKQLECGLCNASHSEMSKHLTLKHEIQSKEEKKNN